MPISFIILSMFFFVGVPLLIIGWYKRIKSLMFAGVAAMLIAVGLATMVWVALSHM